MTARPTPVTTTDALLSLVLDELQALRSDVAAQRGGAPAQPDEQGRVELREPDPSPRQRQRNRNQPVATRSKPDQPPRGPSGVSPSSDGRR